MGMRLAGRTLQHSRGFDIASDGIAPGSIQVPGNGQPIVLLADRQTTGGYPKIATVISADMPALGAAAGRRQGRVRAGDAWRRPKPRAAIMSPSLQRCRTGSCRFAAAARTSSRVCIECNLVSGVVDAAA